MCCRGDSARIRVGLLQGSTGAAHRPDQIEGDLAGGCRIAFITTSHASLKSLPVILCQAGTGKILRLTLGCVTRVLSDTEVMDCIGEAVRLFVTPSVTSPSKPSKPGPQNPAKEKFHPPTVQRPDDLNSAIRHDQLQWFHGFEVQRVQQQDGLALEHVPVMLHNREAAAKRTTRQWWWEDDTQFAPRKTTEVEQTEVQAEVRGRLSEATAVNMAIRDLRNEMTLGQHAYDVVEAAVACNGSALKYVKIDLFQRLQFEQTLQHCADGLTANLQAAEHEAAKIEFQRQVAAQPVQRGDFVTDRSHFSACRPSCGRHPASARPSRRARATCSGNPSSITERHFGRSDLSFK